MQVNVLIPVHNRIDATLECLDCLKRQKYKNIRIIVVDDGSTDGTYQEIKKKHPEVEILQGDGNLWWTGAMYMGVEHILRKAKLEDFILSLNNDTFFESDFIESLVSESKKHGRAIIGSMEKSYFDRDEIIYRGEWLDWKKFSFDVKSGPIEDENSVCNEKVNVLPGRGMLIPVEVFKKIGNFNKKVFPHYIADYDFTVRAFNAGIKLVLSYKSIIYSRTDLTGISITEKRPLTLKETYINYFSIKSDQNMLDQINFLRMNCPVRYRYKHIIKLMAGMVLRLIMGACFSLLCLVQNKDTYRMGKR